ncbi:hypothetical protein FA13DRAFT_1224598 [Coprinellus micaceus]|uniref:Uncharacterized protein n=1 Tax=Coprinellus micaceus TaxID=71717 RepID=A0A4Y7TPI2_COPMI|nr:hypothetical protein FA13DRAFT_1224598 [Coprinellus micaceus]
MTSTSIPQAVPTCSTELWALNSRSQSPCSVAGVLAGVCTDFDYILPPLLGIGSGRYFYPAAGNIPGMGNATRCICNTVYYALESACAACQDESNRWYSCVAAILSLNRSCPERALRWSDWSSKCDATFQTYPESVPSDVVVPNWAYLDVAGIGQAKSASATQPPATPTRPMRTTSVASASSASTDGKVKTRNGWCDCLGRYCGHLPLYLATWACGVCCTQMEEAEDSGFGCSRGCVISRRCGRPTGLCHGGGEQR